MASITEYAEQTLHTFSQRPFSEVDSLVLSQLSYIHLDAVFTHAADPEIRDFLRAEAFEGLFRGVRDEAGNRRLLTALAASPRFRNMRAGSFSEKTSRQREEQFAAVTFYPDDRTACIVFRGTDSTLVGWKEDFNMAFTCPVPAQRLAAHYAASAMLRFPGEFLLGGHSKGGNLAVYAAAFCPAALQERIAAVYNNDGPGFDADVIALPGYQRICARVQTFVPQSSIVGMLLEHEEAYTIIHSTGDGFGQHNLYTWEVLRDRFVTLETVTNGSRFLDRTLKQWLAGLEPEQRERTIDTVYHMLCETNAETLHELKENRFSRALALLRSAKGLDEDTRKLLVHAAGVFFRSAGRSLKQARVPEEQES